LEDLDDGRPDRSRLRPELRLMLEAAERAGTLSNDQLGVIKARAASELGLAGHWDLPDELPTPRTFTLGDPAFRCRLYRGGSSTGTILFLHGGGWVVGSLDTHDGAARALAKAAGCNLLSVEYRKAPEQPFPAGLDDAETALRWIIAEGVGLGLTSERIILAGDSAGANLAAAAAVIWSWTSIRVPQAREAAPERSRANPQVLRNQWNEPSRRRERKQTS